MTGLAGWEQRRPPGQASSADLLWYYFPGDIEIRSGGAALASVEGSIPALHFVAAMIAARGTLTSGENLGYSYHFTEVDQCISFRRNGDEVHVECNFAEDILRVSFSEFSREVGLFAKREIQNLEHDYPDISVHPLVQDLLSNVKIDK